MLTLEWMEAEDWCLRHGVALDERRRPVTSAGARTFSIPVDAGQRIALVADHLREELDLAEALVWYTEWGVWPSSERPHIFERFRASYGVSRPLSAVPAHLFQTGEAEDMLSFVTLGVLFLWDVFVIVPNRLVLFYSHDEIGWHDARAGVER